MADPFTLKAIGAGGSILGGITSAIGSIFGGQSKGAMYDYQAGVAKMNADIARGNANYDRSSGGVEAQNLGFRQRQQIGETTAARGASGVDIFSGTSAKVIDDQRYIASRDQRQVRENANRRAYGHEVEAMNADAQEQIYKMSASGARTAGIIGGIGSILGTAGSVADKWLTAKSIGMYGTTGGYAEDNKW